jgi:asparagine synthase (glutamine-hydrolysing)
MHAMGAIGATLSLAQSGVAGAPKANSLLREEGADVAGEVGSRADAGDRRGPSSQNAPPRWFLPRSRQLAPSAFEDFGRGFATRTRGDDKMCGFSGEIRFDDRPVDVAAITRMTDALTQRGPDGSGLVVRDRVGLGHRRLRIIDLSDHAQQPMVDAQLGLTIAFNGAIYNYKELRAELEQKGHRFFSHGDTEVILKAYAEWGEQSVERLSGMFAFAIHERDGGRLFLARDRLGIKPLYLAEVGRALRFASSLPALLASGGIDTNIDPVGLHNYMTLHAIVPPPRTILRGVQKLEPATTLTIEADGRQHKRRYWEVSFETPEKERATSFEAWQERAIYTLRQAVKRRTVADVPVGVLLSGGFDSSLIVGLLAELNAAPIETFSIGFESVDDQEGDEFFYSDLIAKHYGTRHHKLFIDSSKALPSLPGCIAAMSEPMVSHDVIGFYLLSEEVKKYVKVVQSGQGADEIFAGYRWYPPLLESAESDSVEAYRNLFFDRDHAAYGEAVRDDLVREDYTKTFVREHFARPGASRTIDRALRIDSTIMLVDDPVKRVDNMTMAFGLEARVPFLDHEVVECAASIPAEYKTPQGGKWVIKEAARKVLPNEVIDRPKGSFPVPALVYLRGPYLEMTRAAVTSQAARERGLFKPSYVEKLLAHPEAHITPLKVAELWQIALLELWLQTHVDGAGK